MSCRLGRRSWGADLGEAGPQSREGAQNVGRTICDRSRKFGVEQPSGRGRNGRITAGCHRLFLVTRWGSFAKETGRSQCTPSTIVLGVHCDRPVSLAKEPHLVTKNRRWHPAVIRPFRPLPEGCSTPNLRDRSQIVRPTFCAPSRLCGPASPRSAPQLRRPRRQDT